MTFSACAVFDLPRWQRRVKPSCLPSMPLARVQSLLDITCCKASKHTVVASMPSLCRCCHQRLSDCVINVVTFSQNRQCQRTSLAGNHSRGNSVFLPGVWNPLLVYPRQAWCRFVANSPTTTRPLHTRGCTSYRLDTRSPLGKPSSDTTNSHWPEGLRSRATSLLSVTSRCPNRNAARFVQ